MHEQHRQVRIGEHMFDYAIAAVRVRICETIKKAIALRVFDLNHQIEYPERDCLFYRLTNSDPDGRYRVVKHVLTDPHLSVLLVHTRLEVFDESLHGKLRLYALLAPHLAGF